MPMQLVEEVILLEVVGQATADRDNRSLHRTRPPHQTAEKAKGKRFQSTDVAWSSLWLAVWSEKVQRGLEATNSTPLYLDSCSVAFVRGERERRVRGEIERQNA